MVFLRVLIENSLGLFEMGTRNKQLRVRMKQAATLANEVSKLHGIKRLSPTLIAFLLCLLT